MRRLTLAGLLLAAAAYTAIAAAYFFAWLTDSEDH